MYAVVLPPHTHTHTHTHTHRCLLLLDLLAHKHSHPLIEMVHPLILLIPLLCHLQIDLFKQKYVEFFRSNLIGYAESQLAHSRQGYENIAKLRDQLVQEK